MRIATDDNSFVFELYALYTIFLAVKSTLENFAFTSYPTIILGSRSSLLSLSLLRTSDTSSALSGSLGKSGL